MTHRDRATNETGSQTGQLDPIDARLLDRLQAGVPLEPDPWSRLGLGDELSADQVLQRVTDLKERGVIRQIAPIYDTAALGYTSVLVAARVPEDRLDQAAAVVSRHPGVSHNYSRPASYNLWFTLAVPPGQSLDDHLDRLATKAGLESVRPLPATRTFHIGVRLDMSGQSATSRPAAPRRKRAAVPLSVFDKQVVRVTQDDLPLIAAPFEPWCKKLDIEFEQLKQWFERMQAAGAMRRFAAILRHRQAGFSANGMGVWLVSEDKIEQAGRIAAEFPQVSHCYQRPAYEDWPYNFYTMVHARSRPDCEQVIARIAEQLAPLGVTERHVLYSATEYKKARVRYFIDESTD